VIRCRERLGGLLEYYRFREAAWGSLRKAIEFSNANPLAGLCRGPSTRRPFALLDCQTRLKDREHYDTLMPLFESDAGGYGSVTTE